MTSWRTFVCVACLVLSSAATAFADDIRYPPEDGHSWWRWAWPDGGIVGDCLGNCGAGCGTAWNPCGGRDQYWELEIIGGPNDIGYDWPEVVCEGDQLLEIVWGRYEAWGRWTYYGHSAAGCFAHDTTCPEFLYGAGCLWWAGCGTEWDEEWDYEYYFVGERRYQVTYLGSCSNPPDPI